MPLSRKTGGSGMKHKTILILGATGMLGHTLLAFFSRREDINVHATVRSIDGLSALLPQHLLARLRAGVDADNFDSVAGVLAAVKPDVVINCIGIVKQLPEAADPIASIAINALFPHRLANECGRINARLIHISTDCVFSGNKGGYAENDFPDCGDLYGRTKLLGEVAGPGCVTLRTSIIGHELNSKYGLIEWFLSQKGKVRGFAHAIYTGFPTSEMAHIIGEHVIPNKDLNGLYHVSSDRISKYDLLRLVAERYGKQIKIERHEEFYCDRSLDSSRFRNITGYRPPPWREMVDKMYQHFLGASFYRKS